MMEACPKDPGGKDAWWDRQGAVLLRLMLHAGALVQAPITAVATWVADPRSAPALAILQGHPAAAPGWAHDLAAMLDHDGEYVQNVAKGAMTALDWLADPAMAATACPQDSWEGLDAREFIEAGGTVYLIGTDRPHNSLAPYFATFTAHLFDTAKEIAARSPGTRCDPPLTLVIDEPANTCPVPLDRWSAEAGGHGVTLVTGFQSRSQMEQRWGAQGALTIWNNATLKLIYGGFTHDADLEAFSRVCGDVDTWEHVKGPGGAKTKQPRTQRLFPPERIRMLKEGTALVLHRRTRPLVAEIEPVWQRPGYQAATVPGPPEHPQEPGAQPAIEAAHAEPVPVTDGRPPAPVISTPATVPVTVPDVIPEEVPQWLQA
jgi:type IV secretory pathway TraG/TraD family ATPase VirD4